MAKIVFVYPDGESLGIAYLMSVCRQAGHEVGLVFFFSGESYYDIRKKLNVNFQDVAQAIVSAKPDIVGFSCVSDNYQMQLKCAEEVKKLLPDGFNVFGGFHPTAVPDVVLKEKAVDCVAIGEAEDSFKEFLEKCRFDGKLSLPQHPVNGIVFKRDGNIIGEFKEGAIPDVNALPFPYKQPFYKAHEFLSSTYSIMTGRGCPYSCSYCFNSYLQTMRGRSMVRQRTVENVISELIEAKRSQSFQTVSFQDDCFTANEKWLTEFCDRYRSEINIPFACSTIPFYINKNKVEALRKAGCQYVQIGVQSLNEEFCKDVLLRKSSNAKIEEAIFLLKDAGLVVVADHILAIPGDTIKYQEEAVLFYNQFRPHGINIFYLSYFPKTKITEMAFNKGILNEQDIAQINEGKKRYLIRNPMNNNETRKEMRAYSGLDFLLRYFPVMPPRLVRFLVERKLYSLCAFMNNRLTTVFARVLLAIFQRKNLLDRRYIPLVLKKLFSTIKVVYTK